MRLQYISKAYGHGERTVERGVEGMGYRAHIQYRVSIIGDMKVCGLFSSATRHTSPLRGLPGQEYRRDEARLNCPAATPMVRFDPLATPARGGGRLRSFREETRCDPNIEGDGGCAFEIGSGETSIAITHGRVFQTPDGLDEIMEWIIRRDTRVSEVAESWSESGGINKDVVGLLYGKVAWDDG